MAQKGSNLIIQEARQNIMSSFNNALQEMPVAVLELIVKELLQDINVATKEAIEKEQQEYQQEMQKEFEKQNKEPE